MNLLSRILEHYFRIKNMRDDVPAVTPPAPRPDKINPTLQGGHRTAPPPIASPAPIVAAAKVVATRESTSIKAT